MTKTNIILIHIENAIGLWCLTCDQLFQHPVTDLTIGELHTSSKQHICIQGDPRDRPPLPV